MKYIVCVALPFLVTFMLTPFFIRLAKRFDIVDHPGKRKIHKKAIPLLGGAAIYCGLLAGLLVNQGAIASLLPIIVGATIILSVGLVDDIRGLSAQLRFFVELFVVLVLVKFGVCVSFLPSGFWGDLGEIAVTLVWVVGVTNACNYLDGLDGLATGSAIINLFSFSVILHATNQPDLAVLAIALTSACLGFLPYNFRKAKIFLGDAGSTFLGFSLACIAISGNWAQDNVVKLSIPMLVLGVPIFDMIFTTILRIREEKVKTKEIGDVGESMVIEHEKTRLTNLGRQDILHMIQKIPEKFAVGYDITSFEGINDLRRLIEVKTSISRGKLSSTNFHMTPSEWSAANSHRSIYFIYRLMISSQAVSLFIIKDPVGKYKEDSLGMVIRDGADIKYSTRSGNWDKLMV